MPPRSNIFQRLVAAIHRELGAPWSLTESRMLADTRTGALREVDIVAEAVIAGYPMVLSVEVRDRSRPADVSWVETMVQKHKDLPTSKLALWSSTGFTNEALRKAALLGAATVTPGTIDTAPWARMAQDLVGASVRFVRPAFTTDVNVQLPDGTTVRWPAPADMVLKQVGGELEATVGGVLHIVLNEPAFQTALMHHAPDGAADFHAVYRAPFPCTVHGPDGQTGTLVSLVISIATVAESAPVVTRSAVRDSVATTLAEAHVCDGVLQITVRESQTEPATIRAEHRRDE